MGRFLLVRNGLVVPHDLEVEIDGGEVGERFLILVSMGVAGCSAPLASLDSRLSKLDVLQPDDDLLVQDVERNHAALVVLDARPRRTDDLTIRSILRATRR